MALSETDLQLLDSYLDDELSSEECESLRTRLASEPELADAMDQVRFDREARQQFFSALDPDAASVQRLGSAVHRSVNRELIWMKRARALRMVSGIAACLLVGFSGGYMFRGKPATSNPGAPSPLSVANSEPENRQIYFPSMVNGQPNIGRSVNNAGNTQLAGYEVKLTDEAGNVIGTQHFPTLDQARDFANSVNRWRRDNTQLRNGGVRLVGDQQF